MDQANAPEAVSPPPVRKRSVAGALLHWLRDLVFSFILAVIVILFLYRPVKVEGTSMMPTLDDQERIFINQFTYRFHFGNAFLRSEEHTSELQSHLNLVC